jgi:ubiquinone/menaquinone biosynthesis C-methylase UbiE
VKSVSGASGGAERRPDGRAIEYFDSHAEHYDASQYRTGRRTFINSRHDRIVSMLATLDQPASATVLDAGCGPGNLVLELAARYGHVCAMDASPRMVSLARSHAARHANVSYHVGNIEALPFADGAFDLVCSAGVIEYLPRVDEAVKEMRRVLRPGGLLVLSTTNAVAPAHWVRPVLEPVARVPVVARAFGLQPGDFQLTYHRIGEFKKRLAAADRVLERERHFYLTLPRPLDRLLPGLARRLETAFDRCMGSPVRHLAEGYIAVARRPAGRGDV